MADYYQVEKQTTNGVFNCDTGFCGPIYCGGHAPQLLQAEIEFASIYFSGICL